MAASNNIPTEREVLRAIYDQYKEKYEAELSIQPIRQTIVPIDLQGVATTLGISKYVLFGYLHYHLDAKYRYPAGEKSSVHLFMPNVGELRNGINFPYLVAILAGHEDQARQQRWSTLIASAALILSIVAIAAQVLTA